MVPVLIHLLNRRRYRDEPWAAMQFILSAVQRTRRRLRTEQWILLAVRTLVMALVGLVVARPYFAPRSQLLAVGEKRIDRVLVLDDSLSMRAGTMMHSSALERAKSAMLKLMDRSGGSGGFAVVTASRPVRAWFDQPVQDRLAVRQVVEGIKGTHAVSDLNGAVELADAILARGTAPAEACELYVFSDFCGRDLGRSVEESRSAIGPVENAARVVLIQTVAESRPNRAITDLRVVGQPALLNGAAEVLAEITNFSSGDTPATALTLRAGKHELGQRSIPSLAAGARTSVTFHVRLEPGRVHALEATLDRWEGDWLQEDDHRRLAVEVPNRLRVLLVQNRDGESAQEEALFHFRLTLDGADATSTDQSPFYTTQIAADQFRDVVLKDYDVVAVGDWAHLGREALERLREFVAQGGGLIAFCGELEGADVDGLGELLPIRLLDIHRAADDQPPPTLTVPDPAHPMLGDFAGQQRNILGRAHVNTWRRIENGTNGPRREPVLMTSTGDPILLLTEIGMGRMAIWLTSADMSWTNLPAKPDYLPLMMNLTGFVAGDRNSGRNVKVGESLWGRMLFSESERIELIRPDGKRQRAGHGVDGWTGRWRLNDTALPGIYEWSRGSSLEYFCVNADTAESDLRRVEESRVASSLGDRVAFVDSAELEAFAGSADVRELGWALAVILLLAATTESLLGRWFGGAR